MKMQSSVLTSPTHDAPIPLNRLRLEIFNGAFRLNRIVCMGGVRLHQASWGVPPGWGRPSHNLDGGGGLTKTFKPQTY